MVGCRWKSIQRGLLKLVIPDVMDNSLCISISHSTVEFSWTPKMPLWISTPEGWFLFEQLSCTCPFEQVECLSNTHRCWECYNSMNMIGHHTEFCDGNLMPVCNVMQNFFTKFFILLPPKHIVPILGTPFQVVQILANTMATANQIHMFRPRQVSQSTR
jgi:hypothetical protein